MTCPYQCKTVCSFCRGIGQTDRRDTDQLVGDLAGRRTTMERRTWPKDHLLDRIIMLSRQWIERKPTNEGGP